MKLNPLVIGAIAAVAFLVIRQQQRRAALTQQAAPAPTGYQSVPYNPSDLYRRAMGH
jgi:hypothetical protein